MQLLRHHCTLLSAHLLVLHAKIHPETLEVDDLAQRLLKLCVVLLTLGAEKKNLNINCSIFQNVQILCPLLFMTFVRSRYVRCMFFA